jgi:hypothetical protein
LLVDPLGRRIPRKVVPGLIQTVSDAGTFRSAEARMLPLVPIFQKFTPDEAQTLADASVKNSQIWSAALCESEYHREFSVSVHQLFGRYC